MSVVEQYKMARKPFDVKLSVQAQDVHVSSQKITRRFAQIERVELTNQPMDLLVDDIIDDK